MEVLAYCFMSNHFHILVYVPDPRELSDDELLARIRALYSGTVLAEIERSGRRGGGILPGLSSPCETVSRICWRRAMTRWRTTS